MSKLLTAGSGIFTVFLLLAPARADNIWDEQGNAGELPATAQITANLDPLDGIRGTISPITDVDMYKIFIRDPAAFSATTVGQPGTLFDTMLWLFDSNGKGVEANDDVSATNFRSALTPGNPHAPTMPGFYYLAISSFEGYPVAPGGLRIFPSSKTGIVGPTGPGGGLEITGWVHNGQSDGTYLIALTGTTSAIPEPSALLLLTLGITGAVGYGKYMKRTQRANRKRCRGPGASLPRAF